MPTPVCAFAVKHLRAACGIVITASHNPKNDNGYKVYNEFGAQIVPPVDTFIAQEINNAAQKDIPWHKPERSPLFGWISSAVVDAYLAGVQKLALFAPTPERSTFVLAYTPLHGVAAEIAERALLQAGFSNLHVVQEQRIPDPEFTTVKFPNPEEQGTMDQVIALAVTTHAELAMANDPDGDRFAVAVRQGDKYRMLTGNEVGVLLAYPRLKNVSGKNVVGTTLVSSRLLHKMAMAAGVDYFETLTGFKWLMDKARHYKKDGYRLLFAYEEALGYAVGELVHDKDGISAMVAFAELAFDLHAQGKTVLDLLEEIMREHGFHLSVQRSLRCEVSMMQKIMGRLRTFKPKKLAGSKVEHAYDYWIDEEGDIPRSDMLIFELENGFRVVLRPSGTEPKFKCYYELCTPMAQGMSYSEAYQQGQERLIALAEMHQKELIAH
jgi:phosphomannomutase